MSLMRVSVVVPCYNAEKTLPACLDSIYAQTRKAHEVMVVDDNSTDGSRAVARRYPCRLIELPVNSGVSAARNAGVAASSGNVLFFLDADEALAPEAIANAVDLLRQGYDCVHGLIAAEPLIDDGPIEWYKTLHAYWWRKRRVGQVQTAFFAQAALPRAVFDQVGPFDERLRDAEDLEYSERLAPGRRILLTDRIIARHDEVDGFWPLLREQFRRSQLLAQTVFAARREGKAALAANRPLGVVSVALALTGLPLSGLWPAWLGWTAGWLLVFLLADPGMLRFAARRKGWRFAAFFAAVHLATHVALVTGAAVGAVRWAACRIWHWKSSARLRQAVTMLIVAAAAAVITAMLRDDGPRVARALARPEMLPLVLAALLANLGGLLLGVRAWHVLLADDRARLRGVNAAKVFFLGHLGKYVPGRIWGVVTHVQHGTDHGISPARMTSAYLLSIGLTILTGAGVGLLAAASILDAQGAWLLTPPTVLLLLCVLWPDLATRPLTALAGWWRRPFVPPDRGTIRRALLWATVSWMVSGLHLWALAVALGADPLGSLSTTVGAFGLATVSGSLALIVPDGWGVREVVIAAALATVLPVGVAGIAAIGSRLVCVVAEVASAVVVLAWARVQSAGRVDHQC